MEKLLSDPEVFRLEDIELLKRFYIADNHATTCYDLSIQDGVSPSSYITPIVALAKRIVDEMQIPEIVAADGSKIWWRILFWGRYREDGRFEWKLRPRLAKAMSDKFSDLDSNTEIEEREDNELVEELKHANVDKLDEFEYVGKPKEKEEAVYSNGHKTYPRDRQTALNALAHAHYVCEIDVDHPTFIRKKSDKNTQNRIIWCQWRFLMSLMFLWMWKKILFLYAVIVIIRFIMEKVVTNYLKSCMRSEKRH